MLMYVATIHICVYIYAETGLKAYVISLVLLPAVAKPLQCNNENKRRKRN